MMAGEIERLPYIPMSKKYADELFNLMREAYKKINELTDKVNELENQIKSPAPKRYFREDYGYKYEVDEHGNPIFPPPQF